MRRLNPSGLILVTGFFVLFFSNGSRFALGLMLKPMTDDLEWSRSTLSFAVTFFMFTSALALPLAGRLVDRYSLRWVIAGGAILIAVGIGLMSRVVAPWQVFLVYGLVFAIGHAGTSNPVVGVMISRWFVRRRGIANSVAVSGNAVGQLVIIALLTVFLAEIGWRRSFGILGIANLIIAVPLLLVAVRSWLPTEAKAGEASPADRAAMLAETSVGPPFGGPPSILRSNQFWLLVFLYAICGFQDFFMATHVVAFSLDQGLGTVLAGNVLALMGLMGLVGVLSSGVLSDAFGPARPLALCFLMRIGIFALIMTVQSTAAILTFALLYGFTFLITAPLTVIFAGTIFGPARLGTVTGTISMVHQMSGGLGALAGALIFDHWGSYDGAFMLMLGLSIVAMVVSPLLQGKPMAQVEEGV